MKKTLVLSALFGLGILSAQGEVLSSWDFEEGTGSSTADAVGSNDLTLLNGASFSNTDPGAGAYSMSFDGTDDYLTTAGDNPALNRGEGDLIIKFKLNPNANDRQFILNKRNPAGGEWYTVEISPSGFLSFNATDNDGGVGNNTVYAQTKPVVGQWDSWEIIVPNFGPAVIKRNGVVDTHANYTNELFNGDLANVYPLEVGRWSGDGYYFDGQIDDLSVHVVPLEDVPPFPAFDTELISNGDFLQTTNESPAGVGEWNVTGSNGDYPAYINRYADVVDWAFYFDDPEGLSLETNGGQLEGTDKLGTIINSDIGRIAMNSSFYYRNGMMQTDILNGAIIDSGATYRLQVDVSQNATKNQTNNTFTAALTVGTGADATNTATAVAGSLLTVSPAYSLPTAEGVAPQTGLIAGADLLAAQGSGAVNVIFEALDTVGITGWPGAVVDPQDPMEASQIRIWSVSLDRVYDVGDVNKDGAVDQNDVNLAQDYLDGNGGLDAVYRQNELIRRGYTAEEALDALNLTDFDINGDDFFDADDVAAIGLLVPPIVQIALNVAVLDLNWISVAGLTYDLESLDDLTAGGWQPYGSYTNMAASGTGTNEVLGVSTGDPVRFFRIIAK